MTDWLRSILENLEQPLDPLRIFGSEAPLEVAVVGEDQGCESSDVSRRERGAVADRVGVRRLTGNDRDAGRAQVEFGPATGKRRHKSARDRGGDHGLRRLWTVFRIASHLSDRAYRQDARGAGRKQHRSGRIAGGSDDADALLFCHRDTLLSQSGAALAPEAEARHVDAVLQAIVKRRDQVAAMGIGRKLANMQLAIRSVAADAVSCLGSGVDEARARCAVADWVLRPGLSFGAPYIDTVIDPGQLLVAGRNAAVDQGDPDSGAAALVRNPIELHGRAAPIQRLRQRQRF